MNAVDVLAVMLDVQRGIRPDMDSDDCAHLRGQQKAARAAVVEIIAERDRLANIASSPINRS